MYWNISKKNLKLRLPNLFMKGNFRQDFTKKEHYGQLRLDFQ